MSEVQTFVAWLVIWYTIGRVAEHFTALTFEQFAIALIVISLAAMAYGYVKKP